MDNKDGQSPHKPHAAPAEGSAAALKVEWRKSLIEKRQGLADRAWRNDLLQRVMRVWLIHRPDTVIGAYWPIKGEFDPLPALFRWQEAGLEEDAQGAARLRRTDAETAYEQVRSAASNDSRAACTTGCGPTSAP